MACRSSGAPRHATWRPLRGIRCAVGAPTTEAVPRSCCSKRPGGTSWMERCATEQRLASMCMCMWHSVATAACTHRAHGHRTRGMHAERPTATHVLREACPHPSVRHTRPASDKEHPRSCDTPDCHTQHLALTHAAPPHFYGMFDTRGTDHDHWSTQGHTPRAHGAHEPSIIGPARPPSEHKGSTMHEP